MAPADAALPASDLASVLRPASGVLSTTRASLGHFWAATLDHVAVTWEGAAAAPRGAEDSRIADGEDDEEEETAQPQPVLAIGGWLVVEVGTRLDTQPRRQGSS